MNYDPNWTLDEAINAEAGTPGDPNDPTRPLARWLAHALLASLELSFTAGKITALAVAIRVCIQHELPLPTWAGKAFSAAHDKMLTARAESWDMFLGVPLPKGQHPAAWRKKNHLRKAVRTAVGTIRQNEPGVAIGKELFHRVGKMLRPPIGNRAVEDAYYDKTVYAPMFLEEEINKVLSSDLEKSGISGPSLCSDYNQSDSVKDK